MISGFRFSILSVLLLFAIAGFGQLATPSASSLARAEVAAPGFWGAGQNPAARIPLTNRNFAVQAYGRTLTNINAISQVGLDGMLRLDRANVSLSAQHFSPPGYSQTALHIGAARELANDLDVGIRIGVLLGDYDEYGSETLPVVQAGVQYKISGNLRAGAHYTYVERVVLPLAEHRLRVGIDYASSPRVHLLLAATQPVDNRLSANFGVRYQAADILCLNAGIQTGGTAFSFGVEATVLKDLNLALTMVAYQELPLAFDYGIAYE